MKAFLRRILLFPLEPTLFIFMLKLLRCIGLLKTSEKSSVPFKRVLIVNITGFIGDTVMMLPFLDQLHANLPGLQIDVVTTSSMAVLLRSIPYLGAVDGLKIKDKHLPIWGVYQRIWMMFQYVHRELRSRTYDACILPRWGVDPGMGQYLAAMTGTQRLFGHDSSEDISQTNLFPGAVRLLTDVCHGGLGLPEAVREVRLLQMVDGINKGNLHLEETQLVSSLVTLGQLNNFLELQKKFGLDRKPYLVISPGASRATKRWPGERFAEVAVRAKEHLNCDIIVLGGKSEFILGEEIRNFTNKIAINLAGKTSLLETISLIQMSSMLLANDSGPGHIGAGVGVRTVIVSPSPETCEKEVLNSPLRFRPVGPCVRIMQPEQPTDGCRDLCVADEAHCILGIKSDQVWAQVKSLLDSGV